MSSEYPDDWFRQDEAPRQGSAWQEPPCEDERYTDQFKPGYVEHPSHRPPPDAAMEPAIDEAGPAQPPSSADASHSVGVAAPQPAVAQPGHRTTRRILPIGLGAVALVGAGVALGQLLGNHPTTTTTDPNLSDAPAPSSSPTAPLSPQATPWTGAARPVKSTHVVASCTAPYQQGYDGVPVPSDASRVLDGKLATGWRCDGDGQGQTLTFSFPKGTRIVGVRMSNGYTKTAVGSSLYPQYRRVTTVTWSFPALDNAFFLQSLADDHPALQEVRIPETSADGGMQMQVTTTTSPGSTDSTRNAVVVTEVQFLTRTG